MNTNKNALTALFFGALFIFTIAGTQALAVEYGQELLKRESQAQPGQADQPRGYYAEEEPAAQQQQPAQMDGQAAEEAATRLYISPAGLRMVQRSLNDKGFNAGTVDGMWGPNTSGAVSSFQRFEGLEPTGNLNVETLQALELNQILTGEEDQQQLKQLAQDTGSGGAPIFVSPSSLRQVQEKLRQEGFEVGTIDGIWGPNTSQAIREYERKQGLEPSGNLNLEIMNSLGLNQMVADLTGQEGAQGGEVRGYFGEEEQGTQQQDQQSEQQTQMNEQQQQGRAGDQSAADQQDQKETRGYFGQEDQRETGQEQELQDQQQGRAGDQSATDQQDQQMQMDQQQSDRTGELSSTDQQNQQQTRGYYSQEEEGSGQMARGEAVGQGAPLHLGSSDIRQVEQALSDAGHNVGNVDGKWDSKTSSALKDFQKAQGLEPTGNLNTSTLQALRGGAGSGQQQQ